MAKPKARAAAQPPREADEPEAQPKDGQTLSVEFSPEALDLLVRVCNGVRLTKDDVTLAIEVKEIAAGRVAVVLQEHGE